jgi:AT-rich interactive domain-containing protein 2
MHLRTIGNDEGYLFRELLKDMLNGYDDNDNQQDRLKIIRALEIISNLAQSGNDNGIYLIDYINIIIKKLLHIPDLLILVHTLECLYQLSELGEQLCDTILTVQSSTSIITTFIHLLTIEARTFSSQAIKTIKIVEMSSGPIHLPSYHQPPQQSVVVIPTNQQQLRPLTINGINPIGNILSVGTSSTILPKRKHDCKHFFCFLIF